MSPVIEIEGLAKAYRTRHGRRAALDGFDMLVAPGQVHGFLGPNGSGKTTTLRALLGLVEPDAGRMRLLGRPVRAELPAVIGRVGAVVESPQFFANFTGRHTLRLLARTAGIPLGRVEEALAVVGLADRGDDRVRAYSLGMRQRLAVASALLKAPELLILDEPANGLDPAGIREMRDLMRTLVANGATVLLSSHILGEVQQICDSVTIIAAGRRVATGPVADVLASQDRGEYRVRVGDPERAAGLLTEAGAAVRAEAGHLVVGGVPDPAWITERLAGHGLFVAELTPLVPLLEDVFLHLTATPPAPVDGHIDLDLEVPA
jgi:ABC-2 type transport system ATP-binding protein